MRELTRAEEQVMQVLWKLRKGFVKDILERFDEPKPAYNTVSTIVRILQDKGFVTHKAYGSTTLLFQKMIIRKPISVHL
jgi:BlaI family penicillinase repressor